MPAEERGQCADRRAGSRHGHDASPPAHRISLGGEQWAERAKITLAAVEDQLDLIAQAEAAWQMTPASRRQGRPPAAVLAMLDRRLALEQLRATLSSQLAAWQSSHEVRNRLELTERQLVEVERALQSNRSNAAPAPEVQLNLDRLTEQRDILLRQRDAQRQELSGWELGVAKTVATPLPDVRDAASDVVAPVLALAESSEAPGPSPQSDEVYSPMLAARLPGSVSGRSRQDTWIGAPPQPGAPGQGDGYDESAGDVPGDDVARRGSADPSQDEVRRVRLAAVWTDVPPQRRVQRQKTATATRSVATPKLARPKPAAASTRRATATKRAKRTSISTRPTRPAPGSVTRSAPVASNPGVNSPSTTPNPPVRAREKDERALPASQKDERKLLPSPTPTPPPPQKDERKLLPSPKPTPQPSPGPSPRPR